MRYKILSVNAVQFLGTDFENASQHLSELVNADIQQGWKPLAGLTVGGTQSTHEPYLFQAMILE